MDYTNIYLWACAAFCSDQVEREVTGLYAQDKCLAVTRPWIAPVHAPIHAIRLKQDYALLHAIISAADFHLHDGAWFAELVLSPVGFAAISRSKRRKLGNGLRRLQREGYVRYVDDIRIMAKDKLEAARAALALQRN